MEGTSSLELTAIDLFSGAGGLTLGLQRAGFTVLGALDLWLPAVITHHANFEHPIVGADISSLSGQEFLQQTKAANRPIDLVAGGPPCQGFSIQRIGKDEDDRNSLILEFARFVAEVSPRMFLMENVPGMIGKRGNGVLKEFERYLQARGFDLRFVTLTAAEFGVPQIRKRIFYVGWNRQVLPEFKFPPPSHSVERFQTVWEAIGDLPSPPADFSPLPSDPLHRRMRLSALNMERLRHIPPGGGFESLPVELRVNAHKNGASKIGHRAVYGRLSPDKPAGTITGRFDSFTRGRFAHPYEDRNITLREGARLQTFPDEHRFEGTQEDIAALIGNAVPPLLAEILARKIADHLNNAEPGPHEPGSAPYQLPLFQTSKE